MKTILMVLAVMFAFFGATGVAEAKSSKKVSYAETSLVPWLDARGRPSEFKDRLVLAEIHGVDNFDKSAEKNGELLIELKKAEAIKKKSVVKWLDVQGLPSEKSVRAELAVDHKIVVAKEDFVGSPAQNIELLHKLVEADKANKVLEPVAEPAPTPAPEAPAVPAEKAPEKAEPALPEGAQVASSEIEKPFIPELKDRAKAVYDDYRRKFEERINSDPIFLKISPPTAVPTPAPSTPAPPLTTSGPAPASTSVATPAPKILPEEEPTMTPEEVHQLIETVRWEDFKNLLFRILILLAGAACTFVVLVLFWEWRRSRKIATAPDSSRSEFIETNPSVSSSQAPVDDVAPPSNGQGMMRLRQRQIRTAFEPGGDPYSLKTMKGQFIEQDLELLTTLAKKRPDGDEILKQLT